MRSILEPQNNVVAEWDGLKIRPLDPFQDKTDWERARMLREPQEDGFDENLLIERYGQYLLWLEDVKKLPNIELKSFLKRALAKAREDGRVPDCGNETALKLGANRKGQDLLLFFVKKCPHCRDAFLRGELPPYPWRISQDNTLNAPISINIGSIQSKNLQFGHGTSIHEQQSKEKESVIWKLLKITSAVAAILTILNLLGWLEPIKVFVWPK
jgi:hypothetical protein